MAIRHIVMFRWKATTTSQDVETLMADLAHLPALVPSIRGYDFGPDVTRAEGNFDFVIIASFDDVEGYHEYAADDHHQTFVRERIRPLMQERAALQIGF